MFALGWEKRLKEFVQGMREGGRYQEADVDQILAEVRPSSYDQMIYALEEYVEAGDLESVFRLIPPNHNVGIWESAMIPRLPETFPDPVTGGDIVAETTDQFHLIYRTRPKGSPD